MSLSTDDVKKYLRLAEELLSLGEVFLPDGKTKDTVKKVQEFLKTENLVQAAVVNVKLYEDVKKLVKDAGWFEAV